MTIHCGFQHSRLTAPVFHDIKSRKDAKRPDTNVPKVLGQSTKNIENRVRIYFSDIDKFSF